MLVQFMFYHEPKNERGASSTMFRSQEHKYSLYMLRFETFFIRLLQESLE